MGFKQLIKPFVPKAILEARRDRLRLEAVKEHRQMTLAQAEDWLRGEYRKAIGAELDLENPQRYTEKIQWCKLHAMDATKSMLADKYAVRGWVADRIGEEHLIPLLGVWEDPESIIFDELPDSFVLKTNNASGTNIIVPDKAKLDKDAAVKQLKKWLDWEFGWMSFEPQYLSIPPRIIAEKYIENPDGSEISDYKFICFGGKARFVRMDFDRHGDHRRATFDMDWNLQPWVEGGFQLPAVLPDKPACMQELVSLVEKLAAGFPAVRVDFYVVDGKALFGEMTFSSGAGFEKIVPDEFDTELGKLWNLGDEPTADFFKE